MKKNKIRRSTRDPRTLLLRRIDRKLQDWYRANYPTEPCESCGAPFQLMHHHIEKSQSAALRFNDANLIFLCRKCHALHHDYGDVTVMGRVILRRGENWLKMIHQLKLDGKDRERLGVKELREEEKKWELKSNGTQ